MYRDPVQSLEPLASRTAATRALRVGMIGIGTVGAGTFRVLAHNRSEIEGRAGRPIEVVMVAARNLARAAGIVGPDVPLTADPLQVATHPDVDVVVEVAGGTEAARDWVLAAIAHGKHVVTANKALLAVHGGEIFAAAQRQGVAVAYEAAVAGSVPIVKALREGLAANRIAWVAGIVNGTTNFILSRMADAGLDFDAALAEAQSLGYAEADPAFDIQGVDAAHKLTLLAANAFGARVRLADVQVEGITALQRIDVACAGQLGYRIKLLAVARREGGGEEAGPEALALHVRPTLVPASHLMAHVNGAMNAVMVKGDAAGVTMHYGAGAGSAPTASAVVADLIDVARTDGTTTAQRVPHLGFHAHALCELPVLPPAAVQGAHYLRVPVHAASGIEAVSAWLAAQRVPVRQITLAAAQPAASPQLLVLTAPMRQGELDLAVHGLAAHPAVAGAVTTLHVEELTEG